MVGSPKRRQSKLPQPGPGASAVCALSAIATAHPSPVILVLAIFAITTVGVFGTRS